MDLFSSKYKKAAKQILSSFDPWIMVVLGSEENRLTFGYHNLKNVEDHLGCIFLDFLYETSRYYGYRKLDKVFPYVFGYFQEHFHSLFSSRLSYEAPECVELKRKLMTENNYPGWQTDATSLVINTSISWFWGKIEMVPGCKDSDREQIESAIIRVFAEISRFANSMNNML